MRQYQMSRKDSPVKIQVMEAQRLAELFGYDQIIIIGRRISGQGSEEVVHYGVDTDNDNAARLIADFLKYKVMRWKRH